MGKIRTLAKTLVYATFAGAVFVGCSLFTQGGHRIYFDPDLEYVKLDGRAIHPDGIGMVKLYSLGRHRVEYRYLGGKDQIVDLYLSLNDDSPSLQLHREGAVGDTYEYRIIQ